jgi:hypothetical protein
MVAFPAGDLNMQVLAANGSVFGEIHQPVGRLAGWPVGPGTRTPDLTPVQNLALPQLQTSKMVLLPKIAASRKRSQVVLP